MMDFKDQIESEFRDLLAKLDADLATAARESLARTAEHMAVGLASGDMTAAKGHIAFERTTLLSLLSITASQFEQRAGNAFRTVLHGLINAGLAG